MPVSDSWPLAQAVEAAIKTALSNAGEDIKVVDYVLTSPPAEHIRLEGFDAAQTNMAKDTERTRHPVIVSYFKAGAPPGQKRVHAVLDIIHEALKDLRYQRGRMHFEYKDVESGNDKQVDRGMLRYTIVP